MTLKHVMLDLETWGTAPYSMIIAIGACAFNPYTQPDSAITDRFEVAIDPASCKGLRIDPKTILWWMDPARDEARKYWLAQEKVDLRDALGGFADWLSERSQSADLRIWGNGSDFDNALLAQAYDTAGQDLPWSFRHNRCFRTLRSLIDTSMDRPQVGAHTALADAEQQAIRACQIVRLLEIELK